VKQHRSDGRQGESSESSADALWIRAAVDRYEGPLTHYAAKLVGDVDRARDVVQDTFLKLWTADRSSVNGHLGQWLYRVCRNRALDVCRKEFRMTTLHEDQLQAHGPTAERDADSIPHEDASTSGVLAMLQSLPERQQEVIRMKFQGGLSYREIANVMDLTVNHVGVLIHSGLKTIREKMSVVQTQNSGPRAIPGFPGFPGVPGA